MAMNKRFTDRLRLLCAGLLGLPLMAGGQGTVISRPISSGQMDLMSVPLIVSGGNQVTNVFPHVGTAYTLYFWDTNVPTWNPYPPGGEKEFPYPSREILPGEAFFLQAHQNLEITLTGITPESPVALSVQGAGKANLLGYPYPADVHWTTPQLAALLPPGSMVSFWDRTTSSFRTTFLKAPAAKGGGWGSTASNHLIRAGDGFVVKQPGSDFIWSE
jgi:hypothetical protein